MSDRLPEIDFLLSEVSRSYGGRIETSTDFDALESAIDEKLSERVSAATLKRIWGYVNLQPRQRISTLNILARYAGRKDFRTLCLELQETSGFFNQECVVCGDLEKGDKVELRWMPDRVVSLVKENGILFEVLDPGKSKLRVGDKVECLEFIKGQPAYFSIWRNGQRLQPYVAGRAKGITSIEVY